MTKLQKKMKWEKLLLCKSLENQLLICQDYEKINWNRKKTYCVSHKKDLLKSKSHEYNYCYGEITRKWSSIVEIMKYFVM